MDSEEAQPHAQPFLTPFAQLLCSLPRRQGLHLYSAPTGLRPAESTGERG